MSAAFLSFADGSSLYSLTCLKFYPEFDKFLKLSILTLVFILV